jgi:A/G-specific adenine glycosylase
MHDSDIQITDYLDNRRMQFRANLLKWGREHFREYPWRDPSATPYEVLIAELLLKRTTATATARVYLDFLTRFPTLKDIDKSTEKDLSKALSTIGLQQQRAKFIKALASYLTVNYSGTVPCKLEELLNVPGLGEYSAKAVMSFGCKTPTAIVDANVKRILIRVFQNTIPEKPTDRYIQHIADLLLPFKSHREYNFALLDLGSLICRYINPLHDKCPLSKICDYHTQNKNDRIQLAANHDETNVGIKIHNIRIGKKFSLVKLAQHSGISKLTIINIEAGKVVPKRSTIIKIAHALEIDDQSL